MAAKSGFNTYGLLNGVFSLIIIYFNPTKDDIKYSYIHINSYKVKFAI